MLIEANGAFPIFVDHVEALDACLHSRCAFAKPQRVQRRLVAEKPNELREDPHFIAFNEYTNAGHMEIERVLVEQYVQVIPHYGGNTSAETTYSFGPYRVRRDPKIFFADAVAVEL